MAGRMSLVVASLHHHNSFIRSKNGAPGIATRSKGLTTSNKKLVETINSN